MNIKSDFELRKYATEQMKEIIKNMNGLSDNGFLNKYHHDPYFKRHFDLLVQLLYENQNNISKKY